MNVKIIGDRPIPLNFATHMRSICTAKTLITARFVADGNLSATYHSSADQSSGIAPMDNANPSQ